VRREGGDDSSEKGSSWEDELSELGELPASTLLSATTRASPQTTTASQTHSPAHRLPPPTIHILKGHGHRGIILARLLGEQAQPHWPVLN
jgi:hypothetical protein